MSIKGGLLNPIFFLVIFCLDDYLNKLPDNVTESLTCGASHYMPPEQRICKLYNAEDIFEECHCLSICKQCTQYRKKYIHPFQ